MKLHDLIDALEHSRGKFGGDILVGIVGLDGLTRPVEVCGYSGGDRPGVRVHWLTLKAKDCDGVKPEIGAGRDVKLGHREKVDVVAGGRAQVFEGAEARVFTGGRAEVFSRGMAVVNYGGWTRVYADGIAQVFEGGRVEVQVGGKAVIYDGGQAEVNAGGRAVVFSGALVWLHDGGKVESPDGNDLTVRNTADAIIVRMP